MGGRTDWGKLLDSIAQRYGWSYEEILWKISYVNLHMMSIDTIDAIKNKYIVRDGEDEANVEDFIRATMNE